MTEHPEYKKGDKIQILRWPPGGEVTNGYTEDIWTVEDAWTDFNGRWVEVSCKTIKDHIVNMNRIRHVPVVDRLASVVDKPND